MKIALFKHSNMGSKPCDFFSRSVINKVNEAEPTESKVPFWKTESNNFKKVFCPSRILDLPEEDVIFRCLYIFALRKKVMKYIKKKVKPQLWSTGTLDDASRQFYPGMYVAFVTLLTYPVSTCAAEGSFSGMKGLKNPSS